MTQRNLFAPSAKTIQAVLDATCKHYGVQYPELVSPSRKQHVVNARHVAAWIMRGDMKLRQQAIARALGRTNHTTVINSINQVDLRRQREPVYREQMDRLRKELGFTVDDTA